LLKTNYIFPDRIPPMEKVICKKLSDGSYSKYTTAADFLKNINTDLETLSNDRHIDIFFDPIRVKQIETEEKKQDYAPEFLQRAKFENYLVKKAERLDGNVGYLKFNGFMDTTLSKSTLMASMNFLLNSSALIIDLQQNGGGDARTLSFLLSYFLPDSTLISLSRSRATGTTTPNYLAPNTAINKFSNNVPVYILVSKRTSSAAEAFAYALQTYNRATVIGEITNGEANPGYLFAINKEMYIMIPAFENINPITKTNWQAKGVLPDVQVPADKALTAAQAAAYEKLSQSTNVAELRSFYDWMAVGLRGELQPAIVPENDLKSFAGEFEDTRRISFENGALYYSRGDNKKKLLPLEQDLFGVEGIPYFRIRFIKNAEGNVIALEGMYDDGQKEQSKKIR
ncbi:MAG TPA: S41 family peptidase, partial [Chitinophagaceae bacterium]|nr:S41 family peptidase [Chitinophagaceae bacterium]